MTKVDIPRFMIVGTGSDAGKTTIVCSILKALKNMDINVTSFKCGPDYIDPMFHSKIIDTKSRNLDLYMCGEDKVKYLFAKNSEQADLAVIEGVMGMYDGIGFEDSFSSNHLSRVTATPEILVVNTKGMSLSLVAQIYGYMKFKPNNIKGVILNKTSSAMYPFFKEMIESKLNIKVYGYMPMIPEAIFPSRQLGLVTAEEITDIKNRLEKLAEAAKETLDLEGLLVLAKNHSSFTYEDIQIESDTTKKVKIAVALDKCFCFYYEDNFMLLKKLGAKIEFFSPLKDKSLPKNTDGIIIGGGYPEKYAQKLSANTQLLNDLKEKIINLKIPTIAESGGFIYLSKNIELLSGEKINMAGIIDTESKITDKLVRFGYIKLTAQKDNLLCKKSDTIKAHEFHYSDSTNNGTDFIAQKENGKTWSAIKATDSMFVGFPHLHLWGNIDFAKNFIKKCRDKNGYKK